MGDTTKQQDFLESKQFTKVMQDFRFAPIKDIIYYLNCVKDYINKEIEKRYET